MGWLSNKRFFDAQDNFRSDASMCLEPRDPYHAIWREPLEELLLHQRAWYHLGLCLPDRDPWLKHSVNAHGRIAPHLEHTSDPAHRTLWFLWGNQARRPGSLFALDQVLPSARLVDLLGTGNEPNAYWAGTKRADTLLLDLEARTGQGEKFKTSGPSGLEYLPSSIRSSLPSLTLQPPIFFTERSGDNRVLSDTPDIFEYLFQYDLGRSNTSAPTSPPTEETGGSKPASSTDSLVAELERLKDLVDKGFLTEEQAEQAKQRLLDD